MTIDTIIELAATAKADKLEKQIRDSEITFEEALAGLRGGAHE